MTSKWSTSELDYITLFAFYSTYGDEKERKKGRKQEEKVVDVM